VWATVTLGWGRKGQKTKVSRIINRGPKGSRRQKRLRTETLIDVDVGRLKDPRTRKKKSTTFARVWKKKDGRGAVARGGRVENRKKATRHLVH